MATVASFSSSKITAKLEAAPAPDYAGDSLTRWTLTVNGECVFQDVDQWGLPYNGSPNGGLYDDLCEVLEGKGHLDSAALRAI